MTPPPAARLVSHANTADLVTDSNEVDVDCDVPTSFGFRVDNTSPIELTASGPPSRGWRGHSPAFMLVPCGQLPMKYIALWMGIK